jgi:hypothetical protein
MYAAFYYKKRSRQINCSIITCIPRYVHEFWRLQYHFYNIPQERARDMHILEYKLEDIVSPLTLKVFIKKTNL